MKKVCFLTTRIDMKTGGGSHRHCVSLVRLFREMGYEVEVHSLFSTRNTTPPDIALDVHRGEGLGYRSFQRYIAELMKKNEKETALFFIYGQPLIFGAGKYRLEGGTVPVAVYLDNYLYSLGETQDDSMGTSFFDKLSALVRELPYRMKRAVYDRFIGLRYARAIDRYFGISPYLRDAYVRFGFPADRFLVATHFFDGLSSLLPRVYDRSPISFLYAGRLTYDKGADLLVTALADLKEREWRLRIVGDGPQRDALVSLAHTLGIDGKVTFVSWATPAEVEREYAGADVFVHPARWAEPLGRTIVEAMQYGLPLIVPEKGGPSWAAEGASLTFKNGDLRSLKRAIAALLGDAALRQKFGEAGLIRARAFDRALLAPQFKKEIQELLSR